MVKYLKNRLSLSDKGAKDLVKAMFACTVTNISFMLPVGLLYLVVEGMIGRYLGVEGKVYPITMYVGISVIFLFAIFICEKVQYNATFLASYEESATKRITIAEKLRKIPLSFFGKRDLTDLTTTIMGDCAGLETSFSHFIPELFGAIMSVVIVGIGLLLYNWKLGVSLLWVIPVAFLLTLSGKKTVKESNKKLNELNLTNADSIQECIENIREIKGYNQEEEYLKHVEENLICQEKTNIKTELKMAVFVISSQMLLRVGVATMTLIGAKLITDGEIDFLTFLMFLIAASRVFDPLAIALENLAAIFATEFKIDRMKEIEGQVIQEGNDNAHFDNYNITFNHVNFTYDGNENVLNDVSFLAKQGEITALVGPSGGGKSTVAKLAARFWDITSGKIKVGGKDISNIEPEELLKKYAIVFQDVVLFNNTIMENIRIGKRGASDEEIIRAAKLSCCDEFINKLPKKYNTIIGENGSSLSGGERQRISIARALLKDAPIILLDEATASLDVENESKVQSAISKLVKNKTVLVIAHRMRTIAEADHIIVLEDGKVAEEGIHKNLLDKKGIYNKLWTLQTKAADWTI
ncbi:ABC transporter ATP-binding protein [Clostridium uliginosum]|uniref:ATP-binding cassette, subfamily B n=1 Tax=Clostridium uliginosum TaxID=119641 RepID=A0A1I1RDU9_9CLOT|nr:ABC transporter ATP-binding protein [Clostridium uliginosum]SFD32524.1 ATP-binding cassette, subfamily B [Clostridium uliginosum]